ncbi:hypothetical protein TNCV_1476331 [Trichonephila clavipes]|nr:hypothetical protein TNCV_1476331 [Trichonephila clavipes]
MGGRGILIIRRAASRLAKLVERWRFLGCFPSKLEPNCFVTCMVLKAVAVERRCRDEFRGLRFDTVY